MKRKYKCPSCKKMKMEKQVYTEYRCNCGYCNHEPHRPRNKRYFEETKEDKS